MKLTINSLPSQGKYNSSDRIDIDIEPLTFSKMMKYSTHTYDSSTLVGMAWDIENLIMDIQGWEDLSAFDLTSLIFMRKYISATFNEELNVTVGDSIYKLNVSELTFKDLSKELTNIDTIDIDGTKFLLRIPTIKEYYYACKYLDSVDSSIDLGIAMLASSLICIDNLPRDAERDHTKYRSLNRDDRCLNDTMFNEELIRRVKLAIDKINNSVQVDAVLIYYLINLLMDKYNDVTVRSEGGDKVVSVNSLTTDIFQFVRCNVSSIETKINYFKEV